MVYMSSLGGVGALGSRAGRLLVIALATLPATRLDAAMVPRQVGPDTVRVAVLEAWPPHYVVRDGMAAGFGVDIVSSVAGRVGLVPRFVSFATFPDAIEALRRGDVDVIPDFGITEARAAEFRFTRPVQAFRISLFTRSTDVGVESAAGLIGVQVGAVQSNAAIPLLMERYPGAEIVTFPSVQDAMFALLAATVDVVAYPEEVFLAVAREADLESRLRILSGPLTEVPRALAARASDSVLVARLDRGVEQLLASPEYGEIYRRWLVPPATYSGLVRGLAWGVAALLVALLMMGLWRYHSVSKVARDLASSLSERDAAHEARRNEEERFRSLIESAYGGVAVTDAEHRITFANRRFCELLDLSEQDAIGCKLLDLIDEGSAERVRKGIRNRIAGAAESYELSFRRGDGSLLAAIVSVAPLTGVDGEFEGTVGTVTDISDRIRAEQELAVSERRFRAFVERASDLVSTLDAEGRMVYQSPPLGRLLGYEPDELVGRNVFELVHPEDVALVRPVWEQVVAHPGRSESTPPFRFLHRDGSWRTWVATLTNLLDDPDVGAIVSNARDVTEEAELERRLSHAQRLEAVGRLAGGIAHDFNNILTVIRAQADFLLMEQDFPAAFAEEVRVVQSSSDRAARLTAQLLAFGREQVLRPEIVSLKDVVTDVTGLLSRVIGEDVVVETEFDDGLSPIEVDRGQLEQALMNLGINARDAMHEGGTFRISGYSQVLDSSEAESNYDLGPGRYTLLEVCDTGMGMDEETQAKAFEPFYTTKPRGKGTGLGLAMVYGFVKQSGGGVHVSSDLGRGTTFILAFPAATAEVDVEAAPAPSRTRHRVGGAQSVILVVDDEPRVRRVISRVLERGGYSVREVEEAEAGVEILEAGEPIDLVLTDLVLPGMSGGELVEWLNEHRADMPVVVMSGYAEGSPGHPMDLSKEVAFIQKPFNPGDLLDTIREVLRGG